MAVMKHCNPGENHFSIFCNSRKSIQPDSVELIYFIQGSLKGRQSPKFSLFFNLRNRISFMNLNEQTKNASKNIKF